MIACATINGKPEYKRDSTIKVLTQLFENHKEIRKNVTSFTVLITGSMDPIGFLSPSVIYGENKRASKENDERFTEYS